MKSKRIIFTTLMVVVLLLSSCNLPTQEQGEAGRIATEAALTVAAAMTQGQPSPTATSTNTPPAAPPPLLPTATFTFTPPPAPASTCDAAQFVADVTYPDGTQVDANDTFTKTWRLKNIGTCSWTTAYAVVFTGGDSMNAPAAQALTGNVNSGQNVDISVDLKAPGSPGTYTANFRLRNASGVLFSTFYVQIKVPGGGGGGGGGAFAVTSVTYTLSTVDLAGHTGCPKVTAHISANGEGDVTYHWTRSDNPTTPTQVLHFASAGTQNVSETWSLGSVWAGGDPEWLGIYIDSPNHQDFGHKEVNACNP